MTVFFSEIKDRYKEGRYVEAIRLIEVAEREGLVHPDLLVWKGRCLQLLDADPSRKVSDIENAFRDALRIDETFTPAVVELAWFYLNVLDDAKRAAGLFETAIMSYKQELTEAVVGKAKCLMETESKEAARAYLTAITCLDTHQVDKFLEEIEEFSE